ncbi:MAG: hypothetical protein WCO45_06410 [Pseudanabaena sp. ELA607]
MTKTLNIYTGGNGSAGTLVGSSTSTSLSSFGTGGNSVTWTFAAGLALTDNALYSAIVATGGGINFSEQSANPYPNGTEILGTTPQSFFDTVFQGNFSATPVTAVPFEFETTSGLAILGGAWLVRRRLQQKKSSKV